MLDVHAPHEAIDTRKGFVLHIATITIGLLIAIGLEQTVEFFHHRSVVRETRAALAEEKQENIRLFHENITKHVMMMGYLHNNIRIFEYLRDHPGTPQEKLPGVLYWAIGVHQPVEAAWSTAKQTNALALMPRAEVNTLTTMYTQLEYSWQVYQPIFSALSHAAEYFTHTADASTLSCTSIPNGYRRTPRSPLNQTRILMPPKPTLGYPLPRRICARCISSGVSGIARENSI
jgi:hypothetical protein